MGTVSQVIYSKQPNIGLTQESLAEDGQGVRSTLSRFIHCYICNVVREWGTVNGER